MNFFTSLLIFFFCLNLQAYKNTGFERINSSSTIKKAVKMGLSIPSQERQIKKELISLKKRDKQAFKEKLDNKLANPEYYQSYLLEIEVGLEKVEKAKQIAKYVLYEKFESNWKDLKLTAVNTIAEPDFKKYKAQLIKSLQNLVYVKKDNGYKFEVKDWGYVTVSNNLEGVTWRIEFSSKNDNNRLEEGAENIKIDSSGKSNDSSSDEESLSF